MTERIPQSTSKLVVFKAYLASDHVTEATGKTIAITISKNGATSFSNPAAGATNATEMASGWYKVSLGTGDTDTLGALAVHGAVATVDDVGVPLEVVSPLPTAIEVADALLDRDMSTGTDSGSSTVRTVRQALRFLRNKWSISGTTLSVCKEDDSAVSWTASLTQTAGADPITGSDPTGP